MNNSNENNSALTTLYTYIGKVEPILVIAVLVVLLSKTFGINFPIISVLLVLFCGTLSLIYFFYSAKNNPKGDVPKLFITSIRISYLGLGFSILGVLYKLQFWPFGFNMLFIGTLMSIVALFGLYFFKTIWDEYEAEININILFKRLMVVSVISILLLSTNDKELYKIIHSNDPEKVRLYDRMIDNPSSKEFKEEFYQYQRK